MMLSWACLVLRVLVFYLSWCEVTVVRIDTVVWAWIGMVETVGIYRVMWIVMLESTKDQVLEVDTLGQ
jgi:phage shock protein PspC (stress-responsive transcriptional regulator)